ncbi:alpha/beta hydrolase fold domain-containing protein [Pseudonocardia sp. NPDC049154]|uniref:alpha/beta hydrolase fold domain-containing protein n=1 Tax=Pseudonocardia sp. NPDC049154 TaxID=3155501 RepID=UPI0033CB5D77
MARTDALARAERVYLDGFPSKEDAGLDELRAQYDAMLLQFPLPADAVVTEVELGGVPGLTVAAPGAAADVFLVWFHGGGYVLGSPRGFSELGYALSRATGATVLLPDYRLAPEHKVPAAVEDGVAVLEAAASAYGTLFVGGDSAGGGLALSALAVLRDKGSALPRAAAVVSPLADFAVSGDSIDSNAGTDVAVSRGSIGTLAAAYLQGHDPTDPLASPLYAKLGGLPPVLLLASTTEVLVDDARRVAAGITEAGGSAELSLYEDMCHVWPLFSSFLPEGRAAVEEIAAFLRARQ